MTTFKFVKHITCFILLSDNHSVQACLVRKRTPNGSTFLWSPPQIEKAGLRPAFLRFSTGRIELERSSDQIDIALLNLHSTAHVFVFANEIVSAFRCVQTIVLNCSIPFSIQGVPSVN